TKPQAPNPKPGRPLGLGFGASCFGFVWDFVLGAWKLAQLDRPVRVIQERLPRLVLAVGQLLIQQRAALRLLRLADQRHRGLARGAAALLDVAVHASANDVLPRRRTALTARDHVVQAQLAGRELLAAILALVVVPCEDVPAVELHRLL